MLRLVTFGGLALERDDGPAPRLRPQRLALLVVLAGAGNRGVSRERLALIFWPDSDDPRHSLRQALYALKHELGTDVITGDGVLQLDRARLSSDLADFRSALSSGDRAKAASYATGPFLNAFSLGSSPEFERWADEERATITSDACKVLLALAKESTAAGDFEAAADWWKRLTLLDPLSGRFALGYLKALAASGDRASALAFARTHERLVRRELESDPDPEIRKLESDLRSLPSPEVVRTPSKRIAPVSAPDDSAEVPKHQPSTHRTHNKHTTIVVAIAALIIIALAATIFRSRGASGSSKSPTFAVGMIREEGVPDTLRIGGVLTDMLATNLARVAGLSVVANSRLFEVMLPGQDTLPSGYSEAARRAGATELLQGRLLSGPQWTLAMEVQRIDLKTGLVKGGYRVAAADRYALVDSMTAVIARDLKLGSPKGSIADATTDNPIAYRLYEEGLRAYNQYDDVAAFRLMNAALEEDSLFAMAAYYTTRTGWLEPTLAANRARALRLAVRAPERERLAITADLLSDDGDVRSPAVAESLATKYPMDPRGHEFLSKALSTKGDWAESVVAIERAIAIDSAAEPADRQGCRLCSDLVRLADTYFLWDSVPAAERTAKRALRLRPKLHNSWDLLLRAAAANADTAQAKVYARRFRETSPVPISPFYSVRRDLLLENYDRVESALSEYLTSARPDERSEAIWLETILLRNVGRLNDAFRIIGKNHGPADLNLATAAIDAGKPALAVQELYERASGDNSKLPPGIQARQRTWNLTLIAMALIATGDTAPLRRFADTVEYWGKRSLYHRDRRMHHYIRGMLFVAQKNDNAAVGELRQAISSPSLGFTRVNYELGKALLRLNRPAEAISVARSALHGEVDASNLYITRTELHELLAQAFARAGNRDSASYHYRAVARAWKNADPAFHERRRVAREWPAK